MKTPTKQEVEAYAETLSDVLTLCNEFPLAKTKNEEMIQLWVSRNIFAGVYRLKDGSIRINVHRPIIDLQTGRWKGGIPWDVLMKVKNQCGFANKLAVEVFPKENDVIDTDNIRHLWVVEDHLLENFLWGPQHRKTPGRGPSPKDILKDTGWY